MNLTLYSIKDIKAEAFNVPFAFTTQGQALRAFQDLANDKTTTVGQHPEDYRLFQVGVFDQETGTIINAEQHFIADATDLLNTTDLPVRKIG